MPASLTLLNIIGYGRSGSTLLDIVLGNEPGVHGCGELNKLAGQVWPRNEICGCGSPVRECRFWEEVRTTFLAAPGVESIEAYAARQRNFDGILNWRRVKRGHAALAAHAQQTGALLRAIAHVSGAAILIDSSKSPTWGLMLQAIPDIRVVYLHLIRDGRSVLASLQKPYATDTEAGFQKTWTPPSTLRTALAWRLHNRLAEATLARAGAGSLRVRYEDFVADPTATLEALESATGLSFPTVRDHLKAGADFAGGHTVAGNALRLQPTIALRQGRPEPPAADRRFERIAGRTLRRYGYPTGRPVRDPT